MKKFFALIAVIVLIPSFALAQNNDFHFASMTDEELQSFLAEADATLEWVRNLRAEAQYYLLRPDDLPDSSNATEILFRNIPWGTSAEEVLSCLRQQGVATPGDGINKSDYIYSWRTDFENPGSALQSNAGDAVSIYSFADDFNVAGHQLESLRIYCPYRISEGVIDYSQTHFFNAEMSFQFIDGTAVKYDLITKLEAIYGASKAYNNSQSFWSVDGNYTTYMTWNIWTGLNDTGICLYHERFVDDATGKTETEELMVLYSKTNGQQYLEHMEYAKQNAAAIEEQQNMQNSITNNSGL